LLFSSEAKTAPLPLVAADNGTGAPALLQLLMTLTRRFYVDKHSEAVIGIGAGV